MSTAANSAAAPDGRREESTAAFTANAVAGNVFNDVANPNATVAMSTPSSVHFRKSNRAHPLREVSASKHVQTATCDTTAAQPHEWGMEHPVWTSSEMSTVEITHVDPVTFGDRAMYGISQTLRWGFDLIAGFKTGKITEAKYINRLIFLETVAAIPGMVGATVRHLQSLRLMREDNGWIGTLLEEAENERMHLITFMHMKKPGPLFRLAVLFTQGVVYNVLFGVYLVRPQLCHRLVGYIEEEAVKTYTHLLQEIDEGKLPEFSAAACPRIGIDYWRLPETASFRDLIMAVRADEANHRVVNHTFADMRAEDANPMKRLH